MNIQKFTQKSIEALQNAQTLASTNQNVQVEQEHILLFHCLDLNRVRF